MSNEPIISVAGVSKKFCRSLKRTMLYGVRDVARDLCGVSQAANELRADEFWALDDVSFDVQRGECLGLIGANGAGKSTLLKLLNGITLPDKGTIKVAGRVGALLELGAGFHPMLTGRENIYLSGAILGLSEDEIEKKIDAIVDLAGLEEFIDSPVKHYSSGMYVRLGFATAVHAEPDILLIDEALAVGDVFFQSKCFAKLREFKNRGTTVIFVTHSLELVSAHCSRAMLLDRGSLVAQGDAKRIVDEYNRAATAGKAPKVQYHQSRNVNRKESREKAEAEWERHFRLNPNEDRYGCRKAEIIEAGIFTPESLPVQCLQRNGEYVIKIKVRHHEAMAAAIVAYTIKDAKGVVLCGTNTMYQGVDMGWVHETDVVTVAFKQTMRLNPGNFLLSVGATNYENGEYVVYDRRFDYLWFEVLGSQQRVGLFDLDPTVEWTVCAKEPALGSDIRLRVLKSDIRGNL